jgi:putative oxidoreductase
MAGLVPAIHVFDTPVRKKTWMLATSAGMTTRGTLSMIDTSQTLIFAALGPIYQCLAPWAEAALRVVVGLWMVPHGLRNTFGFFPTTGVRAHSITELAAQLDRDGYRPGKLWAPAISFIQLVVGPLLALGLFTRPAAFAILVFLLVTNIERWRVGKYFWNRLGLEYTVMWTIAAFYFVVHGGGRISLDRLLDRAF